MLQAPTECLPNITQQSRAHLPISSMCLELNASEIFQYAIVALLHNLEYKTLQYRYCRQVINSFLQAAHHLHVTPSSRHRKRKTSLAISPGRVLLPP